MYLERGESKMSQTDCVKDKAFICKIEHAAFFVQVEHSKLK